MKKADNEKILSLIEQKSFRELKAYLLTLNEADIADSITKLPPEKELIVFRLMPKDVAAEVFSYLDVDDQQLVVNSITETELSEIVSELFVDDAVDMLSEMPADVVSRILKFTHPAKRKLINQFLHYPDNSAGSIMTSEFMCLKKDMTVREALDDIRKNGAEKETVYTCYVTDSLMNLLGFVEIQNLLNAKNLNLISEIMQTNVISAFTDDDVEDVAQKVKKYNLLTLPVTDKGNKLVGIVTVDDVVDIITQEAEEDFSKMAAINPSEKSYMKQSVWEISKNRFLWLVLLMVTSVFSGMIINDFESAISTLPILAIFIPMLMDTGGNAGSQTSTTVIRGLALNEISEKDTLKVLFKELLVSLLTGAALAAVNFVRIIFFYPGNTTVALTVSLCVIAVILLAKCLGAILPICAKRLKLDPALMAGPLITTAVDILSLVVYFSLAKCLLNGLI